MARKPPRPAARETAPPRDAGNALCAEQGPRGEHEPRFTRGGRTSGAKSWLEHIADSPVVVVYRFTTGGILADAR